MRAQEQGPCAELGSGVAESGEGQGEVVLEAEGKGEGIELVC